MNSLVTFFNRISDYDITILRWVHHNRIESFDNILNSVSFATTFVSITLLITILLISLKKKSVELRHKFFKILTVFILSAIVSLSLKYFIFRERPFSSYPDIEKLSEAGNSSFPSGHTTEAFAMAFAFSIFFPQRKYILPVFIWALVVAYSRMALGVHYPTDVLSGLLIGACIGWSVSQFTKKYLVFGLPVKDEKEKH